MNNCTFIGRFAADPVLTKTANGIDVCNFVIAVPRPWNSKKTDFFRGVLWRKNAVFINKYFHKGDEIGLCGYMTTEFYEKDGVHQIAYRLVVDDIHPIWKQKVTAGKTAETKEDVSNSNLEETENNDNSENIVNSDDLSVILGSIPEYGVFENPESIDYADFGELYDNIDNL